MTFTVTLSNPATSDVTFDYATQDDTAIAGEDYTAVSGTATIAAGDTEVTITVPVIDDAYAENPETLKLLLANAVNATIADGEGVGTITDESTPGTEDTAVVSISGDASVAEGADATYTVSVDKVPQEDLTVDVTYSYTTASSGDVVTNTTTVTIPAGSTSATFSVSAVDDAYAEGDEVYNVAISNPQGGGFEAVTVGTSSVDTTITDGASEADGGTGADDTATITLTGPDSVGEGETATYTVSVDKAPATDLEVEVVVGHITTDDGDITPVTQTVIIPAGQTSVTFDVTNTDDDTTEGNEDYQVELSGTTTGGGYENVSVDTTPLTTRIMDDEGTPSLIVKDVEVDEDKGSMTFTSTSLTIRLGVPSSSMIVVVSGVVSTLTFS